MPFMIGKAPVRRTLKYLKMGKVVLRDNVKIFSIHYNVMEEHHAGAKNFAFWYLPQIQYKNPDVQCLTFKNLTPSPFIRIYFEDGKSTLIDVDSRDKEDILNHLVNFTAVCKTRNEIKKIDQLLARKTNSSYFGFGCEKHCICEIMGQVPCSSLIPVPKAWRGLPDKNPKYVIPPSFMELGLEKEKNED